MSDDMVAYVVRQGDYLVRLAWMHGFDAEEVWAHEKNKALADLRKDHHILAPGDVLFIPVKKKEGLPIQKGVTNKYVAKVPKVTVCVILREEGKPLANEPYTLEGVGEPSERQTDVDGKVSIDVPVHVREVKLVFHAKNLAFPIRIGDMDPSVESSGIRKRLQHLGYYGWHLADSDGDTANVEQDRAAIQAFQRDKGLEPTGHLDHTTREAVIERHGR
jgi:hypothetical protein